MANEVAKRKYLFVINSLAGGGAERIFTSIINHPDANPSGVEVHVALLDEEPSAYSLNPGIPVYRLDSGGSLPKSLMRLNALVRRLRPNLLVSFLTRANVACVMAGKLNGVPTVISERTSTHAHLKRNSQGALAGALVRLAYPRCDGLISVSLEISEEMTQRFGVAAGKVETIYNPVDAERIRKAAAEPVEAPVGPYVMGMGRLTPSKNFQLLIDAYRLADPPFRLVIAGEGGERATLEAQVAAHGLGDRVAFVGFQKNPFALLAKAEAFVLASDIEGFPNSLVEAMALDVPVISANCPTGPAEILAGQRRDAIGSYVEADSGILFEPGSIQDLAQALRRIQDVHLRGQLADQARKRVADFSAERAVAAYWRTFDARAR